MPAEHSSQRLTIAAEIHPLETRSAGQGLNVTINLLFTFIIAQTFVKMLCSLEYGVFIFFAGWLAIATAFTYFFIPETKVPPPSPGASPQLLCLSCCVQPQSVCSCHRMYELVTHFGQLTVL